MANEAQELVFVSVSGRVFAVPAAQAREVLPMAAPTPVPAWPEVALGVIDLRGEMIPLIDLGPFLGRHPSAIDPSRFILVVTGQGIPWGFVIDRVEVVRPEIVLPPEQLAPPSALDASPLCLGMVQAEPEPIVVLATDGIWERLRIPDSGEVALSQSA